MGGGLGQPRRRRGDRRGDRGVLGDGCGEPVGVVGGESSDANEMDADAAHGLDEVSVGDRGIDGRVQPPHQLVVLMQGGILAADQFRGPEQLAPERIEGRGVAALGGQGGSLPLEGLGIGQFIDVVQGIGDDDAAAARRRQPFGREPAQGLPQRSARDAETFGLLHFRKDRPGQEAPLDDVVAQGRIGLVAGAHPDSFGGGSVGVTRIQCIHARPLCPVVCRISAEIGHLCIQYPCAGGLRRSTMGSITPSWTGCMSWSARATGPLMNVAWNSPQSFGWMPRRESHGPPSPARP